MSGPERQVDDRLADWVDGTLSERERDRFVAELRVSPQLRQDLADYEKTVATVRAAMQAPVTPTNLADRVFAAIAAEQQAKPAAASRFRLPALAWRPSGWRPVAWSVASAAAVLFVALLVNAWSPTRMTVTTAKNDATLDEILAGKARSPGDGSLGAESLDAEVNKSALVGAADRQDAAKNLDAGRDSGDDKAESYREQGVAKEAPARTELLEVGTRAAPGAAVAPGGAEGKDVPAPVHAPTAEVEKSVLQDDKASTATGFADRSSGAPSVSAPAGGAVREALVPEPLVPEPRPESRVAEPERDLQLEPAGVAGPGTPPPDSLKRTSEGPRPGSDERGPGSALSGPGGPVANRARGAPGELLPLVVLQGDAIAAGLEANREGRASEAKTQPVEKTKSAAVTPNLDLELDAFFTGQMRFAAAPGDPVQLPVQLPSLRFRAVPRLDSPGTGGSSAPAPSAVGSSSRPSAASDPSGQDAIERTWLVEGRKEDVAVLLRRLGVFANTGHLSLRIGETREALPAVADQVETAGSETGVPAERVAADQAAGDVRTTPAQTRIVLRFRVLRR